MNRTTIMWISMSKGGPETAFNSFEGKPDYFTVDCIIAYKDGRVAQAYRERLTRRGKTVGFAWRAISGRRDDELVSFWTLMPQHPMLATMMPGPGRDG